MYVLCGIEQLILIEFLILNYISLFVHNLKYLHLQNVIIKNNVYNNADNGIFGTLWMWQCWIWGGHVNKRNIAFLTSATFWVRSSRVAWVDFARPTWQRFSWDFSETWLVKDVVCQTHHLYFLLPFVCFAQNISDVQLQEPRVMDIDLKWDYHYYLNA